MRKFRIHNANVSEVVEGKNAVHALNRFVELYPQHKGETLMMDPIEDEPTFVLVVATIKVRLPISTTDAESQKLLGPVREIVDTGINFIHDELEEKHPEAVVSWEM